MLNSITKDIWQWCERRQIFLFVRILDPQKILRQIGYQGVLPITQNGKLLIWPLIRFVLDLDTLTLICLPVELIIGAKLLLPGTETLMLLQSMHLPRAGRTWISMLFHLFL